MICQNCQTENADTRKYCKNCGDLIGFICPKCMTLNEFSDKFCGNCGLNLEKIKFDENFVPLSQDSVFIGAISQYNSTEIAELLVLRNKIFEESERSKTLTQDEIDNIFG